MNVTLGELFHITSGGTPLKSCKEYYGGNIPWVKTGDLKEMYLQSVDGSITELGLQKSAARMYKPGTVLLAMYGATIGAASILRISATTNQACAAFIKNEKILPEYLYYFLSSRRSNFIHDGVGGAQPNISIGYLKQVPIDLPNISRQKEITDILGRVSILIKNNKCILAKLDALAKARFIEMFGDPVTNPMGWEVKTVGEIASDVRYGTSAKANDNGKYKYLRMNNLTYDGYLDLSDLKFIDVSDEELEKYVVRKGDVLFNRTNSTELVGKTALFDFDEDMIIAGYIIRVRLNEAVSPVFFTRFMNLEYMKTQLQAMAKGAVNQANINAQEMKEIEIYLPPIALQNKFATFVQQVDKSKSVLQKLLEKQELLRAALMQEYFG